jgi:hypothetical protein
MWFVWRAVQEVLPMLKLPLTRARRVSSRLVPAQRGAAPRWGTRENPRQDHLRPGSGDGQPRPLRSSLDLVGGEPTRRCAHNVIRETLRCWGCGDAQLVEDAQLLVDAVLGSILSQVPPHGRLRIELTYRPGRLRIRVTVRGELTGSGRIRPVSSRGQDRRTLALLDNLTETWSSQPRVEGEQLWFMLRSSHAGQEGRARS